MASQQLTRGRKYVHRRPLRVLISHLCSLLAGLLFVGWMVLLVFCMDLLDHKGFAIFDGKDAALAHRLAPLDPPAHDLDFYQAADTGMLPTLVRLHDTVEGPALEAIYQSIPMTHQNLRFLLLLWLTALSFGAVRMLLLLIQNRLLVSAICDAQRRLQHEIYQKQFQLSGSTVHATPRTQMENLLQVELPAMFEGVKAYMERIVREPAKIIGLLVFALWINLPLGLTFVTLSLLTWLVGSRLVRSVRDRGEGLSRTSDSSVRRLLGLTANQRVITGYSAENYYQGWFDQFVEKVRRATEARLTYQGRLVPLWQFAGLAIFIIILFLASHNVLMGKFELAAAAGLFASLLGVPMSVYHLLQMRQVADRGSQAAQRIFDFLDTTPPEPPRSGSVFLPTTPETIDFEHVTYSDTEGRTILSDVSIRIHRGQRIGIMAKTEAERHAFIFLLARLIEPTTGRIKMDGVDLRKGTMESLRQQVLVVLQSDQLFPDSIAANIACGDPSYGLPQITEAAKIAHAHHFISRLPGGYECVVGAEGFPLKRDEIYRLALARAILRDPPIVCVEEPLERLTPNTKSLLDDTMERFCHGRTLIVLPSRLSTLRSCDQIFLFNDGKLSATGTHRELGATSELYRHLQYVEFHTPTFAN